MADTGGRDRRALRGDCARVIYERLEDPPHDYVLWEVLEATPLSKAIENSLVGGAPVSMRSSDMAFLCRTGLNVGNATADLDSQIPGNARILKQ